MASAPVITFPGIEAVRFAHVVRAHGVTPSVISLTIAPQQTLVQRIGDLTISYEGTKLTIPDCIVDSGNIHMDPTNRIVGLTLLDRRWRWQFAQINGVYNHRNPTGDIDPATRMELPRLLWALYLAMEAPDETWWKEGTYDQTATDIYPEVQWNYSSAALELAALCDTLGYRVILAWDNGVYIKALGAEPDAMPPADFTPAQQAAWERARARKARLAAKAEAKKTRQAIPLPIIRMDASVDPKERPDAIGVATAPVLHQVDFELEAVGKDLDGSIKPIGDLSFKPKDGWAARLTTSLGYARADASEKETKAKLVIDETVFKWYRIKVPVQLPGVDELIDNLDDITPIHPYLVETTVEDGRRTNNDAIVYGQYWNGDKHGNNVDTLLPLTRKFPDDEKRVVDAPFTLDRIQGIVKFHKAVFRRDEDGKGVPAILRLRAVCEVRTTDHTRKRLLRDRELDGDTLGTPIVYSVHNELQPFRMLSYDPRDKTFTKTVTTDNVDEIREIADSYLDGMEARFEPGFPTLIEYAGFYPVELNAVVRVVEFVFDASGRRPISTIVQFDQDKSAYGNASYAILRNHERVTRLLREQAHRTWWPIDNLLDKEARR